MYGIPLGLGATGQVLECACSDQVVVGTEDHHHSACVLANGIENTRSKLITKLIWGALVRAWGSAIKKIDDRSVPRADGRRSENYADIAFTLNGATVYADISVIDPASNMGKANGSLVKGGRAGLARDHQKRVFYTKLAGAAWVKKHFVPLSFESTGRPSKSSSRFFTKYITKGFSLRDYPFGNFLRPITKLHRNITLLCVEKNAEMLSLLRANLGGTTAPLPDVSGEPAPLRPVPYTRRSRASSTWEEEASDVLGWDGPPLCRAARSVSFPSLCSNVHCPHRTSEPAAFDVRCDCGKNLCFPCSRIHNATCKSAPAPPAWAGFASAGCSYGPACRMTPLVDRFRVCLCDQDTATCDVHWKEHMDACPEWRCWEPGCNRKMKSRCGCTRGFCTDHGAPHKAWCDDAKKPAPPHEPTKCCVPECTRHGMVCGVKVCNHCRQWVCAYHTTVHADSCRAPFPPGGGPEAATDEAGTAERAMPEGDEYGDGDLVVGGGQAREEDPAAGGSGGGGNEPPASPAPRHPRLGPAAPSKKWAIFTDGSCSLNRCVDRANPRAGWGFVVTEALKGDGRSKGTRGVEASGVVVCNSGSDLFMGAAHGSNNSAELTAIGEALLWSCDQPEDETPPHLEIYADSTYAIKAATGKSKAHAHPILAKTVQEYLATAEAKFRSVSIGKVRAHAGKMWNDRADKLAKEGDKGIIRGVGRWAEAAKLPKGEVAKLSHDEFTRAPPSSRSTYLDVTRDLPPGNSPPASPPVKCAIGLGHQGGLWVQPIDARLHNLFQEPLR